MQRTPRRRGSATETEPVTPLATALAAFLRTSGLDAVGKNPQIETAWGRIVGPEFSSRTRVLGLRKGVVEIGVASSALMSEIRFHEAALLADLRREVRRPRISGISFRVAPVQESDEGTDRP